jgi:Rrf2 family protein
MLISTKGRYALRILVDMAEHQTENYITLQEVAQRQDISEKYLESIVRELVKKGIVAGQRGKGGGYRLCAPPEKINVGEVLRCMEGSLAPVACLNDGAVPCTRAAQCRTLEFWRGLNEVIDRYTGGYTIADMMQTGGDGDDYII